MLCQRITETLRVLEMIHTDESGRLVVTEKGKRVLLGEVSPVVHRTDTIVLPRNADE
jgi:hypothetical protein